MSKQDARREALATFLEIAEDSISNGGFTHESAVFRVEDSEYKVLTDEEADEEAANDIEDSLFAFNSRYILQQCGLDHNPKIIKSLQEMQSKCCEDANPFLSSLIARCCGLEKFIKAAIAKDGRGFYVSNMDAQEYPIKIGETTWFIYQVG